MCEGRACLPSCSSTFKRLSAGARNGQLCCSLWCVTSQIVSFAGKLCVDHHNVVISGGYHPVPIKGHINGRDWLAQACNGGSGLTEAASTIAVCKVTLDSVRTVPTSTESVCIPQSFRP